MEPQQLQDGAGQHAEHRQQGDQNGVTHPGAGLQGDVHQTPGQREAERGDEQRRGVIAGSRSASSRLWHSSQSTATSGQLTASSRRP